ncbi:Uu.00g055860.m01.CDS01 [Anthostomella pinea]|uniref:Uu.00g055860.m01.CDS01 n=1 Tax=Anthostomella pinea TaxID=933095 RepID=A0AAI8VWW8_9PEZI|nr:Uu.00g055860.m01.CDS01 [Anthostomella pinea]
MVSYAAAAASGPRQTPEEAAAPQPPQVVHSESASTSSLVDVDAPSVRTVPSDFMEQDVQTDTQAARRELEDAAEHAASRARAEADMAKKKGSAKARKADNILTQWFGDLSEGASTALVVSNLTAIIALSTYGGYKAWGLYERGRFGWKHVGIGAGVALGVGLVESIVGGYLYKGKKGKQS